MALLGLTHNNDANGVAIAEAGGIAPLVELVRGGSAAAKQHASATLAILAMNDGNKVAIAEAGGIAPLVELLRSGSEDAMWYAVSVLAELAVNVANKVAIAEAGAIVPLIELVRGGSDRAKQWAAGRDSLAFNDANKVAIAEAGGIVPLVELVRGSSANAKREAAGALAMLAFNDANAAIAEAGGIAPLERLARDAEGNAKKWASKALAKARAATERARKTKAMHTPQHHVEALRAALRTGDTAASESSVYALETLSGSREHNRAYTDADSANAALIMDAGGILPLVELLRGGSEYAAATAAVVLGNLGGGDRRDAIAGRARSRR